LVAPKGFTANESTEILRGLNKGPEISIPEGFIARWDDENNSDNCYITSDITLIPTKETCKPELTEVAQKFYEKYSKLKPGNKVKVITEHYFALCDGGKEQIQLTGMEGLVINNLPKYYGDKDACEIDINGRSFFPCVDDIELIKIDYNPKFLNLADDIEGILLPDQNKAVELIQRYE